MIRKTILAVGVIALLLGCGSDPAPVKSNDKFIISFSFQDFSTAVVGSKIDSSNIALLVLNGTDVKALVPTIKISSKASISPATGVATDFTNPVDYTVTAEDGTTRVVKVKVIVNPEVTFLAGPDNTKLQQDDVVSFTGYGFESPAKDKVELINATTNAVTNLVVKAESNDTKLIAAIPADQPIGGYFVRITVGTQSKLLVPSFEVDYHAPVLTSVSGTGNPGSDLILKGSYFAAASNTVFLGSTSTELEIIAESTTQITARIDPDMPTGTYAISVKSHSQTSASLDVVVAK